MFSYWKRNGALGLRQIINDSMSGVVVDHLDTLARNAFFINPYSMFGVGSASGFSAISNSTDRMGTDLLDAIWLGMRDRKVPWAALSQTFEPAEIFCITTPGAIYDLKREIPAANTFASNKFVNIAEYANPELLMAGEIGTYRGVRFIESPMAELWNVGTIITQTSITAAVKPGDGAPDPATTAVDTVRYVGQPGATHTITVTSTTGFNVGEKVTVHKLRFNTGSGLGLTNPKLGVVGGGVGGGGGVDFLDPMLQDMIIYSIPDSTHLVFQEPYMMTDTDANSGKGLETDLGGTVYGYVTKAANVHTAVFLNNTFKNGVVAGVAQPPRFYTPPAVDDFESIYRISYDTWTKYQLWEPQVFEVAFVAAPNKDKGIPYVR